MGTDATQDISELIDNEWYVVRYSGEIPEIAYNSALYFLTRASDGPQITPSEQQLNHLKQAAVDRYEEIVLRDIMHDNVGTAIYRGIARSICNYDRFIQFCVRQNLNVEALRIMAGQVLTEFLHVEHQRLNSKNYSSVLNCSFSELTRFAEILGVPFLSEYSHFEPFCLVAPE